MQRQLIEDSCERLAIATLNERQAMSETIMISINNSDVDAVISLTRYENYLSSLADEITATGIAFNG